MSLSFQVQHSLGVTEKNFFIFCVRKAKGPDHPRIGFKSTFPPFGPIGGIGRKNKAIGSKYVIGAPDSGSTSTHRGVIIEEGEVIQ